jgi:hypothetical protein
MLALGIGLEKPFSKEAVIKFFQDKHRIPQLASRRARRNCKSDES